MMELKLEIKELIKAVKGTFTESAMILIIKEYIRLKTGKEVEFSYNGNVREAQMLVFAFDSALEYITKNYDI